MNKSLISFCIILGIQSLVYSQSKTNLEFTFNIIEKTVARVDSLIVEGDKKFNFTFRSPESYSFLKSRVADSFIKKGFELKDSESLQKKIDYAIENIKVEYTNPFKEQFFGSIFVEREISIIGTALISNSGEISSVQLNQTLKDTIAIDRINNIEEKGIPFTTGTLPEIPLFSNLLEPIIVVGTLIVTIILFFTVRSK